LQKCANVSEQPSECNMKWKVSLLAEENEVKKKYPSTVKCEVALPSETMVSLPRGQWPSSIVILKTHVPATANLNEIGRKVTLYIVVNCTF
jgi:hypothetical protein